jgi:hypothetical protein
MTKPATNSLPGATLLLQPPLGMGQPDRAPSRIARHVSRVGASVRLEDELESIAMDLLGLNDSDGLSPDSADWVAAAARPAVSGVRDAALDGLVQALDSLLADAPPDVARRLDEARTRRDAGYI